MANSINDILYGFKFDTLNLTYNLNSSSSLWNGINSTNPNNPVDFFSSKDDLSSSWKTQFATAIELWDAYSNLSISATTGNANIYSYRADVSGQPGATAWFDDLLSGTVSSPLN